MRSTPPVVIFDLDGTLIDSRPPLLASLNEVLGVHGLRALTETELVDCMGRGLAGLVARTLRLLDADLPVEPLLVLLRERYDVHCAASVRPFAGVDAALKRLDGTHRLALCTNKPRVPTDAVLHHLGWAHRFEVVAALGDVAVAKPHPALLQRVLDTMHIGPEQAVMVGDTRNDAGAAAAVGMRFFAVAWGYAQEPVHTLGAHAVLPNLAALRKWI